jgi:hypothetical protein
MEQCVKQRGRLTDHWSGLNKTLIFIVLPAAPRIHLLDFCFAKRSWKPTGQVVKSGGIIHGVGKVGIILPALVQQPLSPELALTWHESSLAWLKASLKVPFAGKTVVVTRNARPGW